MRKPPMLATWDRVTCFGSRRLQVPCTIVRGPSARAGARLLVTLDRREAEILGDLLAEWLAQRPAEKTTA